jgi:N-acyl homoserine lactone hydrolase
MATRQYVPVDGEVELLPGLRLVPAPGSQVVVICGDTAAFFRELDELRTERPAAGARAQP